MISRSRRTIQNTCASPYNRWYLTSILDFPLVQLVKDLPAMKKTWVWSLCWEDTLEKRKANHSSILGWRFPERLKAGRERGQQRMGRLDGITNSMDLNLSKLLELVMDRKPGMLQSMSSQRVGHNWATDLNWINIFEHIFKYYSKVCHLFKIWAFLIA